MTLSDEDKSLVIKMLATCQHIFKVDRPGLLRPDKKHNAFINAVATELGMSNAERDAARAEAKAKDGDDKPKPKPKPKLKSAPKPKSKSKLRKPKGSEEDMTDKPSPPKRRRTSEDEVNGEPMDEDDE
ncbi:hypothetical protein CspHIS471_0502210 [Cutaneotrichosporon sp. HIS471]|nr:hypothetical protein CspHIS471_0502210 [Cutaneotrichosporon sp. HIS471]